MISKITKSFVSRDEITLADIIICRKQQSLTVLMFQVSNLSIYILQTTKSSELQRNDVNVKG